MTKHCLLLSCLVAAVPVRLHAALPPVSLAAVPFLPDNIRLNGRLDEPVWREAAFLGPLPRADGGGMAEAATTAHVFATSDRLYVGVWCEEPEMNHVQSSPAAHDSPIWGGDCVELFIQPDPRGPYFHFITNADGACYEERNLDATWNADWEAIGHREKSGWSAEISIPWKAFGVKPEAGAQWRFNLCRSRRPVLELSAWSPTGGGFHMPERFGSLLFGAAAWVTKVDWGRPWLGQQQLRVSVAGHPVSLRVGNSPTSEASPGKNTSINYTVVGEGTVPLVLTAVEGNDVVLRQTYLLRVEPLEPMFRSASDALSEANRAIAVERMARIARRELERRHNELTAELTRLRARAASPSVTQAERDAISPNLQQLAIDAGHLVLRAADVSSLSGSKGSSGLPSYSLGSASSLVKLLPSRPFSGPPARALRLSAARNEVTAVQLVIVASEQDVKGITLSFDGPTGPNVPRLTWRRVGTVVTRKPSYVVEYVGEWPDPLLPPAPFDVEAGKRAVLWIDARVPDGVPAGEHRFTLRIHPSNAPERRVPVVVRVRNFTIPHEHHLRTAFGLGPGQGADWDQWMQNYLDHRISPYSPGGEAKVTQRAAFEWTGAKALLAKVRTKTSTGLRLLIDTSKGRLTAGPVMVSASGWKEARFDLPAITGPVSAFHFALEPFGAAEVDFDDLRIESPAGVRSVDNCDVPERWLAVGAWSRCRGTPEAMEGKGAIRWTVTPTSLSGWLDHWPLLTRIAGEGDDLPLTMDFTAFDAAMERYRRLGLDSFVVPLPGMSRESNESDAAETLAANQVDLQAKTWEHHLQEKGWLKRGYTYLFDEPEQAHYPALNRFLGTVKVAAPAIRNMMTARSFPKELKYVDIWCPEVYSFDPEAARAEQAKGKEVSWYVAFSTRHPYPNFWIDYPALDCRVLFWMTWKHRLDGVLYWSGTYWAEDPWKNPMTFPGANGDGSLLYPGPNHEPIDSIRWECIRDGVQDFEVFCLLESAHDALRSNPKAAQLVREADRLLSIEDNVVKSYKEYNPDPSFLLSARLKMDDCLERCIKSLGKEPQIAKWPRFPKPLTPEPLSPLPVPKPARDASIELSPLSAPKTENGLVGRYDFAGPWPFAVDVSGIGNHALVLGGKRCEGPKGQPALCFESDQDGVRLPGGSSFLGSEATEGTVALWARPDFDPTTLPTGLWEGYQVIAYLMQTDGNGLPDGYDEIGLYLHGPNLFARVCGLNEGAFASIPCPLRKGEWTHLAITFTPCRRVLYVNGKPVATCEGTFVVPKLDNFPGALGYHPSSGKWQFHGAIADVRVYRRALSQEDALRLVALNNQ